MLGIGHGVANDVLEEDLEDTASLLVDETADTLDSATASQAAYRRFGDALDVVPEHLPVPLRSALAQALSSLSSTRHFQREKEIDSYSRERDLLMGKLRARGFKGAFGRFELVGVIGGRSIFLVLRGGDAGLSACCGLGDLGTLISS